MRRWILGSLLVLAAIAVGWFALYRLGKAAVRDDPDGFVILKLRHAGSDLTRPHPIEFFLYLPTEDSAKKAAARFVPDGYAATVRPGADDKNWLCLLTRTMVPDHAAIVQARRDFTAFVREHGGEYDGWGSPVVN